MLRSRLLFYAMRIAGVFLLLIAPVVSAGVYKWTDNNGNVHYSDRPVAQDNATEVNINADSSAGITNSTGHNRERDLVLQELEEDRKARQKSREEKRLALKKRQQRCARAKDDLRQYRNASAIYNLDDKGERVYYSKEKRKAREQKLSQLIAKNCR